MSAPNPELAHFLPETENRTLAARIFRDDPAKHARLSAEAATIIAARKVEEQSETRLFEALHRLDPAAATAARETWAKSRAGRQA